MWISFIEFSEFALRSYHVILGVFASLAPLFFYKTIGKNKALTYTLILISNLTLIKFSQQALVYATTILFLILFILFYERALKKKNYKDFIPVVIILVSINYLNYFALLAANLYVFFTIVLNIKDMENVKNNLFLMTFSIVSFIPWVFTNHLFRSILGLETHRDTIIFWNHSRALVDDIWRVTSFIFNYDLLYLSFIVLVSLYSLRNKFSAMLKNSQKRIGLLILSYFTFIIIVSLGNNSLFVDRYFLILIPFVFYAFVNIIETYKKNTQTFILTIIILVNIIPFNSYRKFLGDHDYKSPLIELAAEKNDSNVKLVLFIYNPDWLNGYIEKYSLRGKYNIIGKRSDCQYSSAIKEMVKTLKRGDIIYLTDTVCRNKFLLKSLSENNLSYTTSEYTKVRLLYIN